MDVITYPCPNFGLVKGVPGFLLDWTSMNIAFIQMLQDTTGSGNSLVTPDNNPLP